MHDLELTSRLRRDSGRAGLRRDAFAAAILGLLAIGLVSPLAAGASDVPDDFVDEPVLGGLSRPVGLAFLPDGRLLFVEQWLRRIRLIVNGAIASIDPVCTVPDGSGNLYERGLLGIAVDPRWPEHPYVYVHVTHTGSRIRISRFRASGDLDHTGDGALSIDPASRYDLLTDILDTAQNHNGGSVRFGPDGKLYVSLGEDANMRAAQDTTSLRGVILRLEVTNLPDGPGTATRALITPPDNPFSSTGGLNARLIWAWGLRNPFRIQFDPKDGDLFIADVGDTDWEEINRVPVGGGTNFGWPRYEGTSNQDTGAPLTGPATFPIYQLSQPVEGAAAIMAAGVYRRPLGATRGWPLAYEGDLFVSDFFAGMLRRLRFDGANWSIVPAVPGQPSASNWGEGFERVCDYAIAPDGSIYYTRQFVGTSSPGEIRRILPAASLPVVEAPPAGAEFRRPHPVPSHGAVDLEFSLAKPARVRLAIYDVRGRLVRLLVPSRIEPAGAHRTRWDGLGNDGRAVGSGLYFARLEVDRRSLEHRIPVIR